MLARPDGSDVIPTQKLASEVLVLVEENTISVKEALRRYFEGKNVDYKIRGSVHAYVFEVLKRRNLIDFILERSLGFRNLSTIKPFIRNLLRIGVYEMHFKGVHPALATDSAVRIAKEISERSASFVNAILRNAEKVDVEGELRGIKRESRARYLALKYFHPEWYVGIAKRVVEDWKELLKANLRQATYIRANTLRRSPENVVRLLEKQDVHVEETPLPEVFKVISYEKPLAILEGYERDFVIQDLASCLVSYALNPQPDEIIADLASAPGSKTSHISAIMENKGRIIAVDNSAERVERMKARLKRLGVKNVEIHVSDGTKFNTKADKVLLDVPCSSTGSVRSYPSVKWRFDRKKFQSLLKLQQAFLRNSAEIGDEVVYSTCSITFEENEGNLLLTKEIFDVKELKLPLGIHGIKRYGKKSFRDYKKVVRLYPHIHDTAGFFISKLQVSG